MYLDIVVIDDIPSVCERFETILVANEHRVHAFHDLIDGVTYLRENYSDVVFLDNHFSRGRDRKAIYGVDQIPSIVKSSPECRIVLMSSHQFKKEMMKYVVQNKIEYYLELPAEDEQILEVLRCIMLSKKREDTTINRVLDGLRGSTEGPEGLLSWLRHFVGGKDRFHALSIDYKGLREKDVLLDEMRMVDSVRRGQEIRFSRKRQITSSHQLMVQTKYGIGLNLDDTTAFFSSELGLQVKSIVEKNSEKVTDFAIQEMTHEEVLLHITESDIADGVYVREIYGGVLYDRYAVVITATCESCHRDESCTLYCFIPKGFDYADVTRGKFGEILRDERARFKLWVPRSTHLIRRDLI